MKFGKRKAAALLSLAAFGVLGTSVSANADTGLHGFTILHASKQNFAHTCTVIGQDTEGHQAVICVDITTTTNTGGTYIYEAFGKLEAYCQEGSGSATIPVECAEVDVNGQFSNAAVPKDDQTTGIFCGHQYSPCNDKAGRNFSQVNGFGYFIGDTCSSTSTNEVWMIAEGGSSTTDTSSLAKIELPGTDKWTYLGVGNANDGHNESTGHYYICD